MAPSFMQSNHTSKIVHEEEEKEDENVGTSTSQDRMSDIGTLHKLKSKLKVLILAEGWPSWFFAIQGLGFTEIRIRLINTSLSVFHEIKHTIAGKSVTS